MLRGSVLSLEHAQRLKEHARLAVMQISQGYVDALFNKYGQNAHGKMPIMVGLCGR